MTVKPYGVRTMKINTVRGEKYGKDLSCRH